MLLYSKNKKLKTSFIYLSKKKKIFPPAGTQENISQSSVMNWFYVFIFFICFPTILLLFVVLLFQKVFDNFEDPFLKLFFVFG